MIKSLYNKAYNVYHTLPTGAKASAWFAFCNVMQKGIQMITVPIFTRTLTTQQYGQFTLYQSWLNVITIFATLMLYAGVFNNGMLKYGAQKEKFIASMQGLSTTATALLFILYLLGAKTWEHLLGLPRIIILGMFLELLFSPALQYWSMRQRYEYKYRMLAAVTLTTAVLNPLLGLLAIQWTEEKGIARILSVSLLNACVGLVFYIYNLYKGRTFYIREYWKFALSFNLPLIPHYLSNIILAQSDRIMIEKMFGTTDVAIYSLAYSVGMVMSIIYNAINASFTPWTYQKCKAGDYQSIRRVSNVLAVVVAVATMIPIAMAPELIAIMGTAEYAPAMWVVGPVAISSYLTFLYSLFGNIEFYFEKSKFVMVASCTAAITNVILNLLLMPVFGYIAAAYTTVFCYMLLALAHYYFMIKVFRQNTGYSTIYDIHFLVLLTVINLLAMFVLMALYNHKVIRYAFVFLTLCIAWKKREKIRELVKIR